jgi:hypothetical protein
MGAIVDFHDIYLHISTVIATSEATWQSTMANQLAWIASLRSQ